jgi:CheY-like chemotaxis protein
MSHSVLVIDDLSFYRRRLRNLLRELGYRVHEATTAKAGIEMARRLDPDYILLDEIMPGENTEQTLAELRDAAAPREEARIIVLSPRAEAPATRELLDRGADAVLAKTVGRDEIQSAFLATGRASAA